MSPPTGPPTPQEVRRAARAAINIFESNDMTCCLFGSLACRVYGVTYRGPKDVDLIVLKDQGYDSEELKQFLVDSDDRFCLVGSINPDATYQVLYFTLPSSLHDQDRKCKVDILTTGRTTSLNIPPIPRKHITHVDPFTQDDNRLPVMPLLALLMMKLQGWVDHRRSREGHKQKKVPQDVKDIDALVEIAVNDWEVHLENQEERWLPRWFVNQSKKRVDEYLKKFPWKEEDWESLGF
ncbi:hypothetical protein D9758_013271 [Tetrapyrgos nigripes]|uniref:Uncharacterized protein n=1 Tax=Tetrapyrgos nigripes TaxID=182062 RepID=A0A8H5CMC5_9AGAR|nr:hypothetical protein D9758_013271 [Tetrapyrgos nigripes]